MAFLSRPHHLPLAMLAMLQGCSIPDLTPSSSDQEDVAHAAMMRARSHEAWLESMHVDKRRITAEGASDGQYFNQPIPEQVHQIWFGDLTDMEPLKVTRWRAYARAFDVPYRLWTNDDYEEILELLPEKNRQLFTHVFMGRHYHAASDLVRVALLRAFGGIYADVDIGPPVVDDVIKDMRDYFPFTGFVAMGEHRAREIGSGSIFLANGFLMAAKGHPLLGQLEDSLLDNVESINGGPIKKNSACYSMPQMITGPFYLSRNLYGVMTTTPISYLIELGMVD